MYQSCLGRPRPSAKAERHEVRVQRTATLVNYVALMSRICRAILSVFPLLALSGGCTNFPQRADSGHYGLFIVGTSGHSFPIQESVRSSGFPPSAINAPIRSATSLAVAQIGEPAAPSWLIDALSKTGQFRTVTSCEGGKPLVYHRTIFPTTHPTTQQTLVTAQKIVSDIDQQAFAALDDARAAAECRGCDYLALLVWNADGQLNGGVMEWLDILIFPMYVIPHDRAIAHASGLILLVDVRDGAVVRKCEHTTKATRFGTYMAMPNVVRLAISDCESRLAAFLVAGLNAPPNFPTDD